MYYLKVTSHFDAAHYLRNYQGKCANMHGHTWEVQVIVKGISLNHQGILIDFGILKELVNNILKKFDHKIVNELEDFNEQGMNPTAENIAAYVYNQVAVKLPKEIKLESVEVWESPKSSAVYRKE